MKKYSKVGNRAGKPAYRTPSSFRVRKNMETAVLKGFRRGRKDFFRTGKTK